MTGVLRSLVARVASTFSRVSGVASVAPVQASPATARAAAVLLTDEDFAGLIQAYAAAKGWAQTYASRRATGSGDTLDRIAGGGSLTLQRARAILQTISDGWPDDAEWPAGIERPEPTKREST